MISTAARASAVLPPRLVASGLGATRNVVVFMTGNAVLPSDDLATYIILNFVALVIAGALSSGGPRVSALRGDRQALKHQELFLAKFWLLTLLGLAAVVTLYALGLEDLSSTPALLLLVATLTSFEVKRNFDLLEKGAMTTCLSEFTVIGCVLILTATTPSLSGAVFAIFVSAVHLVAMLDKSRALILISLRSFLQTLRGPGKSIGNSANTVERSQVVDFLLGTGLGYLSLIILLRALPTERTIEFRSVQLVLGLINPIIFWIRIEAIRGCKSMEDLQLKSRDALRREIFAVTALSAVIVLFGIVVSSLESVAMTLSAGTLTLGLGQVTIMLSSAAFDAVSRPLRYIGLAPAILRGRLVVSALVIIAVCTSWMWKSLPSYLFLYAFAQSAGAFSLSIAGRHVLRVEDTGAK